MAKLTKFQRSQKAHARLARTHTSLSMIAYHQTCHSRQSHTKRVMTRAERKKIFDSIFR